jgi:hypothetical protein
LFVSYYKKLKKKRIQDELDLCRSLVVENLVDTVIGLWINAQSHVLIYLTSKKTTKDYKIKPWRTKHLNYLVGPITLGISTRWSQNLKKILKRFHKFLIKIYIITTISIAMVVIAISMRSYRDRNRMEWIRVYSRACVHVFVFARRSPVFIMSTGWITVRTACQMMEKRSLQLDGINHIINKLGLPGHHLWRCGTICVYKDIIYGFALVLFKVSLAGCTFSGNHVSAV